MSLRSKLIRLAYQKPQLRSEILPLLKKGSVSDMWKKEGMDKKLEALLKKHKVVLTEDSSPYKPFSPISSLLDEYGFCIEFERAIPDSIVDGLQDDDPEANEDLADKLHDLEKKSEKILKDMKNLLKKSGFGFQHSDPQADYKGDNDAHSFVKRFKITES